MISTDIFIKFLRCRLAGYLLSKGEVGNMAIESDINHFRKFCETILLETESEIKSDVKIHFQKEFEVEDLKIKPDAIINSEEGIILVKYKLSTFAMNDYDLWELAFNAYVLKAFDITVKEFRILSINHEFKLTDNVNSNLLNGGLLEKAVRNKMFDIPKYIKMMRAAFELDEEPKTRLGPKCEKGCPFIRRCYPYYKSNLKISDMGYSNKISLPWNEIKSREDIPIGTQFTSKQWHEVNAVFSSETQSNNSLIRIFIEGVFKNKNVIYLHLMGIHSYFPTIVGAKPYDIVLFQYDFIYSKKSQTPHLTNNINKKLSCPKSTLEFYVKFIEDISFDGEASIVVYEYERTVETLNSIKKYLPNHQKAKL